MPFYEYRCGACGHELEVLQKMADEPLLECPACQAHELVRLISAPAFRLKGGGWYETDFKSGNKRNLVESGSESKADSPKAESAKVDSAKAEAPKPAPVAAKPAPTKSTGEGG
jgi:putative FmdB family regulatory protein